MRDLAKGVVVALALGVDRACRARWWSFGAALPLSPLPPTHASPRSGGGGPTGADAGLSGFVELMLMLFPGCCTSPPCVVSVSSDALGAV
jgi:hypothetical protein